MVLVVAILAWAPFPLGSYRPWSWSILAVLTVITSLVWLASMWAAPGQIMQQARKVAPPLILGLAALAWGAVQIVPHMPASLAHPIWSMAAGALRAPTASTISLAPWQTETELMKLGTYAMMAWLAYALALDSRRAKTLLQCITVVGVFYMGYAWVFAMLGLHQFEIFYHAPDIGNPIAAPFVNRNTLATFAGLVTLCCGTGFLSFAARSRRHDGRLASVVLGYLHIAFGRGTTLLLSSLLSFSLVMATGSLGGTISVLAGILAAATVGAFVALRAKTDRLTALTALVCVAALAALLALNSNALADRLDTIASAGLSEDLRVSLWLTTQRMIHDAPLTGLGLGTFEKAYPLYAQSVQPFIMDKAHNDYLELAAGWGLPAAFAWWISLLWLVGICIRGAFIRRGERQYCLLAIAAAGLVATHSVFDFSLQIPAVSMLFTTLLGLGVAQSFPGRERQAMSGRKHA